MLQFGQSSRQQPPFLQWVLRDPPALPTPDESSTAAGESPWLNKPAPDFKVPLLDGRKLALADLRGKPVMLDFWATWCGPCIASMPTMLEVADEFAGKVELIAINLQEDPDEVRAFVESRLWNLRVGLDADGSLGQLFGVHAIPFTLILDRDGVVRHVHLGAFEKDELTGLLKQLVDP
jgi:thiol-disulfide isomerase/thioredoxin